MQNHILAAHPWGKLSCEVEPDGSGNLKPCFAGCHSCRHIRTSHTCGKSTQRAICTGMGIRSDHYISGYHKAFFRKNRMLDSHFAHFKVIGNLIAVSKFPHAFAVLCGFNILVGDKVIRHKGDFIFIKNAIHLHLFHFLNRNRTGNIISKHQIQIRLNQLARFYFFQACMGCQNLLCHCHTHFSFLRFHWFRPSRPFDVNSVT